MHPILAPRRSVQTTAAAAIAALALLATLSANASANRSALDAAAVPDTPVGLDQTFGAELYKRSADSVVLIFGFGDGDTPGMSGAGFFVDDSGLLLTHAANLIDPDTGRPWRRLVAYRKPETVSSVDVQDLLDPLQLGIHLVNEDLGLALLRTDSPREEPTPIELTCRNRLEVGSSILAIGHGNAGLWATAAGIINNRGLEEGKRLLVTSTPAFRGSRGGPLLDESACAVGLYTSSRSDRDGRTTFDVSIDLQARRAQQWFADAGLVD